MKNPFTLFNKTPNHSTVQDEPANVIINQRNVAQFVLGKIQDYSSTALIAGGMPRDHYFGNAANDIDIFISHRNREEVLLLVLSQFGNIKSIDDSEGTYDDTEGHTYEEANGIEFVYEFQAFGETFQLVFVDQPPMNYVNVNFASSIAKATFSNTHYMYSSAFINTIVTNTITVSSLDNAHAKKMQSRFPSFAVVEEQL